MSGVNIALYTTSLFVDKTESWSIFANLFNGNYKWFRKIKMKQYNVSQWSRFLKIEDDLNTENYVNKGACKYKYVLISY